MILMLLCAKTARTDGHRIFQYVDLTAPNVAAGNNIIIIIMMTFMNCASSCKPSWVNHCSNSDAETNPLASWSMCLKTSRISSSSRGPSYHEANSCIGRPISAVEFRYLLMTSNSEVRHTHTHYRVRQ